jgi:hypothetical protein
MAEQQMEQDTERELTAAEEAAEIAAGFDAVRFDGAEVDQEPEETEDEADADHVEPEPDIPGLGMTASQVRAQLEQVSVIRSHFDQQLSKAHGKIGELNRTLQELKGSRAGPGKVNTEALRRLRDEYGSDLADTIASMFTPHGTDEATPAQPSAPEDINAIVERRLQGEVSKLTGEFNQRLLSIAHPDWRELPRSPDWSVWFSEKTPEQQAELRDSEDASWVAQQLTEFKGWVKAKQAANAASARSRADKSRRLETAVAPMGAPATSTPANIKQAQADFEAGFKAARGT